MLLRITKEILLNKLNKTFFLCSLLVILCVTSSTSVFARAANPPNKSTGAPNEGTCASAGCHTGNDLNAAGGSLMLSVPDNYTPGAEYDIVVELARAGQSKWGFQMTALNSIGTRAGTFAISNANTQQLEEEDSKQYIEHKAASGTNRWTFKWTAPSSDVGPITFYAAGNAANNNFWLTGDYIYTQKATSDITHVYGISLAGVGSLNKTAKTGVETRYTLSVTNTGNTRDTISLSTSGIGSAKLSRTSVALDADTSANVTLTIPGSALTSAGEYKTTVTATSQGDSSKTASRTTTTTILPEYDVGLTGVGNITRQTADASTGVSYTLRVTNSGNTNDTFRLTTSGDATATISPSSVFLNQGSSRTVTLRISGTALARAGDYNVKVTATSQGDSTKTDEITTTTTILPVYDIALAGVGEVTTETSDASDGVSYTLKITNNGNTDDKVDITTSGDVAAILSSSEVSIAYGASANVTITISGNMLALAGAYGVKVTATSQGDSTKTTEITTTTTILPVYDIALEGIGEVTTETADASDGVSYTLKITNNGNTDDVIDLATEGTAATLSQMSVSLASGASAEVMLTISGDTLALAGTYEVQVTATSQGDDTQTAEVTTTTTILPVYDITLEGVGEVTTETSDVSDGVSYTLKITNNGNTDDVIDLATEGTAATLSQTSVSLASGASAEVMLTISGDVLALAGDYEVKVTATSQGDRTKTTTVTTTTTVLPVFGVMLASNTLTGATMDMVAGVTYTLTVTNAGNTDDTILLGSSAEVGIGGAVLGSFNLPNSEEPDMAQLEIMLVAGESTEVEFTASGDLLTQPGEYEIVVTATSQGNTTKIAQLTTTTTMTAVPPEYGVQLQAEGELTGTTMDAIAGATYALTVTNTGNTADTIVLSSSAEVGIEGVVLGSFNLPNSEEPNMAQLEIMLDAGASMDVLFTAAGDFFTKPGEYEIVVTTTSQGDTTKTAQLTTTTTITAIPPEYGVQLHGVGELTGATWNFLKGITYELTITNTGNTEDTIMLGSSAEVGIGGAVLGAFSLPDSEEPATSQLQITLDADESVDVIFTVSGDLLTQPGEYEIVVTATSQGDTTKTAEITTTTTIEPVPWDINADGEVNILDLVAVAKQFGESGEKLSGDVNMDGEVNILDLVAVANQFGKTSAEIVQAANQ